MAYLIQNQSGCVNVIETTGTVGEKIYYTFSNDSNVQPIKGATNKIKIIAPEGLKEMIITMDGTVEYQDDGGIVDTWGGTLDDFLNKLNNEYFSTSGGGGGGGDVNIISNTTDFSTATKQDEAKAELQSIDSDLDLVNENLRLKETVGVSTYYLDMLLVSASFPGYPMTIDQLLGIRGN